MQADFPRIPVGILALNRNPDNDHAEVEQVAFSPANVVPGLGYSPDKMLPGRRFGDHDAQLYRVGTKHQHLPVNAPRCPTHNQLRDGRWPALATATTAAPRALTPLSRRRARVHPGGATGMRFGRCLATLGALGGGCNSGHTRPGCGRCCGRKRLTWRQPGTFW